MPWEIEAVSVVSSEGVEVFRMHDAGGGAPNGNKNAPKAWPLHGPGD
jgi:hypothetical protein